MSVGPAGGHDDEAPLRVRPYALVQGRTRVGTTPPLPVEAIVVAHLGRTDPSGLSPESVAIVRHCSTPSSVAEVSAHLALPVGVVRVLVGDLLAAGKVEVHLPAVREPGGSTDIRLLERVLAGLEAL